MRIFRLKEERLAHVTAAGRTLKGIQDYFLKNVEEIDGLSDLPEDIKGYYAVLYNDTPLLTESFLNELADECEALSTSYTIGDGYITKKGYDGPFKKCENIFAFQVKKLCDVGFVSSYLKDYVLDRYAERDVLIYDPATTYIDLDVVIEDGVIIHPMVVLSGKTHVHKNAVLFSNCELIDTEVGENVDIRATYALEAKIGDNTTVGPFACLRKGANIGAYCRVGDFVEIKTAIFPTASRWRTSRTSGTATSEKTPTSVAEPSSPTTTASRNNAVPWGATSLSAPTPIWSRRSPCITGRSSPPAAPSPKTFPKGISASPAPVRSSRKSGRENKERIVPFSAKKTKNGKSV